MPRITSCLGALCLGAFPAVAIAPAAWAAEPVALVLKDHGFEPASFQAPANERFRIEITNQTAAPAEFESTDLRVEKIVVSGGKIAVMAGPLKPGTYNFFNDYHPETAKGTVVVASPQAGK